MKITKKFKKSLKNSVVKGGSVILGIVGGFISVGILEYLNKNKRRE